MWELRLELSASASLGQDTGGNGPRGQVGPVRTNPSVPGERPHRPGHTARAQRRAPASITAAPAPCLPPAAPGQALGERTAGDGASPGEVRGLQGSIKGNPAGKWSVQKCILQACGAQRAETGP